MNDSVSQAVKEAVARMALLGANDIDSMMNLRNLGVDAEQLAEELESRWQDVKFGEEEVRDWRTVEDIVKSAEVRFGRQA